MDNEDKVLHAGVATLMRSPCKCLQRFGARLGSSCGCLVSPHMGRLGTVPCYMQ